MGEIERNVGVQVLEGLILRDSAGALYEVPCVVIDRYRVSDERVVELTETAVPDAHGFAAPPWAVIGGVQTPAAPAAM